MQVIYKLSPEQKLPSGRCQGQSQLVQTSLSHMRALPDASSSPQKQGKLLGCGRNLSRPGKKPMCCHLKGNITFNIRFQGAGM